MTHPNKRKGNDFERELVRIAREKGMEAQRAYASNGKSLGEAEEVDVVIEGIRVQAKKRKKLADYLQIPEGCDVVAFKQDRGKRLILVDLDVFLSLIKLVREKEE